MPLPAALAARLARRGLLSKEEKESKKSELVEEEVFAEEYDAPEGEPIAADGEEAEKESQEQNAEADPEGDKEIEDEVLIHESPACPNQVNPYHKCSDYCRKRWGFKKFKSDPNIDRRRLKMLKKYPLPEGWEEVADPHTGRYYYWNSYTGQVSWLSPQHPRAQISLPAEKLKALIAGSEEVSGRRGSLSDSDHSEEEEDEEEEEAGGMDIDDDRDFEEIEREILMEKKVMNRKDKREQRREKEALDPMDPASYSDIPRGTWTTGLERRGAAKTGVDSTASGPLFQQRPYPSPGSILRMNKSLSGDDEMS